MENRGGVWHRIVHDAREITDVCLTWEPTYPDAAVEFRAVSFVAQPLQEILGGQEGQPEEAATEQEPPDTTAEAYARRLAELRIDVLERRFL